MYPRINGLADLRSAAIIWLVTNLSAEIYEIYVLYTYAYNNIVRIAHIRKCDIIVR